MTREQIRRIDPQDMFGAVLDFPNHLREGRSRAASADLGRLPGDADHGVVVLGMGGSAIGGDLMKTLVGGRAQVTVSRAYAIPRWVGAGTVVIACSYSGSTEETLMSMDQALARGASVLCITTGGAMGEAASERGLPLMALPQGLQPRAALGHSLAALIAAGEHLGIVRVDEADWEEAFGVADEQAATLAQPGSEAWHMARELKDLFPVIYSSQRLEAVNVRWRNQLHENAKTFAVGNVLPEMNHNEIMGWDRGQEELGKLGVVLLRDRDDHPRTQRRMEVTKDLLHDLAGSWMELESRGDGLLARLVSLLYPSDWVSLYLALLHRTDPSPVGLISKLKAALAES